MAKPGPPKAGRSDRPQGRADTSGGRDVPLAPEAPARPSHGGGAGAPAPDALTAFETAIKAMQRHDYLRASGLFQSLVDAFPTERAILDRARLYLGLCRRGLTQTSGSPATVEERLTAATAALNDGRDDEAERLAHAVLATTSEQDLALYLLAAVHARRGDVDGALAWLGRAVDVSPDVRAQARHDVDFEPLRETDAFRLLIEGPASAQFGSGRVRGPDSDR